MNIQDIAALTVIASFIGGFILWAGSKLFATRSDLAKVRSDLQANSLQTALTARDVKWIRARLSKDDLEE